MRGEEKRLTCTACGPVAYILALRDGEEMQIEKGTRQLTKSLELLEPEPP